MIHLITYGDNNFANAKTRLYNQATATGWFDSITLYGPNDLDSEFKNKFINILHQNRGGGYWIWKPYIIQNHLNIMNDNDILIYLDAGCSINPDGRTRLYEYIEMLNQSNECCISFQMPQHIEKNYTIREIFQYFNIEQDCEIANTGQIMGTIQIIKKNSNSIKL